MSVVFELPPSGVVAGTVTDSNDGAPVSGATVALTRADGSVARQTTTGADGRYLLQVAAGTYTLTVTRTNYVTESREVVVETDERLVADFSLETARGSVSPGSLEWLLPQSTTRTADLTLTNDGIGADGLHRRRDRRGCGRHGVDRRGAGDGEPAGRTGRGRGQRPGGPDGGAAGGGRRRRRGTR